MHTNTTKIALLGSTGSIGQNTLEVISKFHNQFKINYLSTFKNINLLVEQSKKFKPRSVVVIDENAARQCKNILPSEIELLVGVDGLIEIVSREDVDLVINALVGFSGVSPTYAALNAGKNIALANKETLVAAGEIIMSLAKNKNLSITPIDSEHSAILQCLLGEENNSIDKIYLTASGGPFLNFSIDDLKNVTVDQALKHPNWSMGSKITIDSATLMNKGLEVIEAHWLFNLPIEKIKVLIHPQSIIHSMVEFCDGSIKAQLGVPDMKIPIQYALTFPKRALSNFNRIDFTKLNSLNFFEPDFKKFPSLQIAFDAVKAGGIIPTILNAANEIAVEKFLKKEIAFNKIPFVIENTITKFTNIVSPNIKDIIETDKIARETARSLS
ncbi:MAG: 1-deoxy-D-xylulose-5-phosphate reductoisomerase [Bacteroidota bacterium]